MTTRARTASLGFVFRAPLHLFIVILPWRYPTWEVFPGIWKDLNLNPKNLLDAEYHFGGLE